MDYGNIVEVVDCRTRIANQYLANGYVLLAITQFTDIPRPDDTNSGARIGYVFVVGRPHGVARFVPEVR